MSVTAKTAMSRFSMLTLCVALAPACQDVNTDLAAGPAALEAPDSQVLGPAVPVAARSICMQVPPGGSWVGKGEDLLYAGCPDCDSEPGKVKLVLLGDGGLEPGRHTVRMTVELPGTRQRFDALASFTLTCGGQDAGGDGR